MWRVGGGEEIRTGDLWGENCREETSHKILLGR